MIETEDQRRWWFATHPEFSSSHRGTRSGNKVDPKEVDKYVDRALKYENGPVADLLKSVKKHFGTEGDSRKSGQKLAFLGEPPHGSEKNSPKEGEKEEPTLLDAVVKGIDNTLQDWQRWLGLSARLPPKGTPERNKIEAARRRGIKAKKAQELDDIRSGGKGSGVWTKQELKDIRKGGDFPDDVRWHHDPTVANRPDLANNPKFVHPMRGGDKGHLYDGHGGNYRNPLK